MESKPPLFQKIEKRVKQENISTLRSIRREGESIEIADGVVIKIGHIGTNKVEIILSVPNDLKVKFVKNAQKS